jgi:hypothetical protein
MAYTKKASNGEVKISMSTPEWVRMGIERGFLTLDPRVESHARVIAHASGIDMGKATYTNLKKAMASEVIRNKVAENMSNSLFKHAVYEITDDTYNYYQGGPLGHVLPWNGTAGGSAGPAPSRRRKKVRNFASTAASAASTAAAAAPAAPAAAGAAAPAAAGAAAPAAAGAAAPAAGFLGGVRRMGGNLMARAGGILGGALAGSAFVGWAKNKLKGSPAPHAEFAMNPQKQAEIAQNVARFNQLSPRMKGMSSAIDKYLDLVAVSVTDTIQHMNQNAQAQQGLNPQYATEQQEYQAQLQQAQQARDAAMQAYQRRMAGPVIPAPTGLPR